MEQVTQEETVEPSEVAVEHIKNLQHPVTHRTKKEIKDDIVPQEVLESTMEVENGYFERFIVKRKYLSIYFSDRGNIFFLFVTEGALRSATKHCKVSQNTPNEGARPIPYECVSCV